MDQTSINKFFSATPDSEEAIQAYQNIREAAREFAEILNSLIPESPTKADIMGRLFRIMVDSELAIRMDGVSTTKNMIVMQ